MLVLWAVFTQGVYFTIYAILHSPQGTKTRNIPESLEEQEQESLFICQP